MSKIPVRERYPLLDERLIQRRREMDCRNVAFGELPLQAEFWLPHPYFPTLMLKTASLTAFNKDRADSTRMRRGEFVWVRKPSRVDNLPRRGEKLRVDLESGKIGGEKRKKASPKRVTRKGGRSQWRKEVK